MKANKKDFRMWTDRTIIKNIDDKQFYTSSPQEIFDNHCKDRET